jgi:hypothetical protein
MKLRNGKTYSFTENSIKCYKKFTQAKLQTLIVFKSYYKSYNWPNPDNIPKCNLNTSIINKTDFKTITNWLKNVIRVFKMSITKRQVKNILKCVLDKKTDLTRSKVQGYAVSVLLCYEKHFSIDDAVYICDNQYPYDIIVDMCYNIWNILKMIV